MPITIYWSPQRCLQIGWFFQLIFGNQNQKILYQFNSIYDKEKLILLETEIINLMITVVQIDLLSINKSIN